MVPERKYEPTEKIREHPILSLDLLHLGLEVLSVNCLRAGNIASLGHIAYMRDTEMMSLTGFGKWCLGDVKKMLAKVYLRTGMTIQELEKYAARNEDPDMDGIFDVIWERGAREDGEESKDKGYRFKVTDPDGIVHKFSITIADLGRKHPVQCSCGVVHTYRKRMMRVIFGCLQSGAEFCVGFEKFFSSHETTREKEIIAEVKYYDLSFENEHPFSQEAIWGGGFYRVIECNCKTRHVLHADVLGVLIYYMKDDTLKAVFGHPWVMANKPEIDTWFECLDD